MIRNLWSRCTFNSFIYQYVRHSHNIELHRQTISLLQVSTDTRHYRRLSGEYMPIYTYCVNCYRSASCKPRLSTSVCDIHTDQLSNGSAIYLEWMVLFETASVFPQYGRVVFGVQINWEISTFVIRKIVFTKQGDATKFRLNMITWLRAEISWKLFFNLNNI